MYIVVNRCFTGFNTVKQGIFPLGLRDGTSDVLSHARQLCTSSMRCPYKHLTTLQLTISTSDHLTAAVVAVQSTANQTLMKGDVLFRSDLKLKCELFGHSEWIWCITNQMDVADRINFKYWFLYSSLNLLNIEQIHYWFSHVPLIFFELITIL